MVGDIELYFKAVGL